LYDGPVENSDGTNEVPAKLPALQRRPMKKLFLRSCGILVLLVLFLGGCSSFHNVSIKSPGEEQRENLEVSPEPAVLPDQTSNPISPLVVEESSSSDRSGLSTLPHDHPADSIIVTQSAEEESLPWSLTDIFFEYDQYTIRTEEISVLEQNAKVLLRRYANREILIEGHCDERGTEEYNFILGDRRAMVVKNYLVDLGVPSSNLQVLSLGKNEPFCFQPTLHCLQKNRRVHFVLK
jgi:peptidoglycan-associated lipoprotein